VHNGLEFHIGHKVLAWLGGNITRGR